MKNKPPPPTRPKGSVVNSTSDLLSPVHNIPIFDLTDEQTNRHCAVVK